MVVQVHLPGGIAYEPKLSYSKKSTVLLCKKVEIQVKMAYYHSKNTVRIA